MPELIGKLQATFKSTLHPSPEWCKYLCMSCFGRVKSALDSSPLFTQSRLPPLFTHSSPGKSALFYRPNRSSFRFNSVRNPWNKNALLTQRNPMNKNIQVKSGLREFSGIMQKLFPYKKYQVGVQFLRWF